MKIKESIKKSVVKTAEKNASKDLNSASSTWAYQAKLPKDADKYRNNK